MNAIPFSRVKFFTDRKISFVFHAMQGMAKIKLTLYRSFHFIGPTFTWAPTISLAANSLVL
jgi:hypothetical protein